MKALLIVSHGSRRSESNREVEVLVTKIFPLVDGHFDIVETAFLELASPLIPDSIECCIRQGATEILVMPYFLAAGRHVAEDIPEIIAAAKQNHPGVSMTIATHLGASSLMPAFIADSANANQ